MRSAAASPRRLRVSDRIRLLAPLLSVALAATAHAAGRDVLAAKSRPDLPSWAVLEPVAGRPDPLVDLARVLDPAEPGALVDFAWIALDEMIVAYEREADQLEARRGAMASVGAHARWLRATRGYASRLRAIAEEISIHTPVEVRVEGPGNLLIHVDGRTVEVSGPRIAEPNYMGRRIVERFCEIHVCDVPVPAAAPEPEEAPSLPGVTAIWRFADGQGPVCTTSNGLEFQFASRRDLDRKRAVCVQVAEQLRDLSRALRRAVDSGAAIDFRAIEILPLGAGRPERVVLNPRGDYLLLHVPSLAASRTLQRLSLGWISASVRGEPRLQSFPDAERLLAELLPPG